MDAVSLYKTVGIFILIALVVSSGKGQDPLENNASPKLIVGTKHIPPFAIKNPEGSWNGISIELWRQIAADLNREYELREVTGGLMHIHSSRQEPKNAYVAVRYRGNWFYIDDSDLTSKSTFSLLTQLFALQTGEIKSTGPILTLPVGR